ncbi:hypothetical protein ACBY01_12060 [Sphingomonas sp. ac-8]|uniref:hypothetical protein n=1 Tax=Sphingomonas sp. ac-8 TaxID=3242977 RepID=UPI003A801999
MTVRIVAAAAAVLVGVAAVAAPAYAQPRSGPAAPRTVPAPAPAESVDAPKPQTQKATRYCSNETLTGSHIAKRVCHTRDEWLGMGVDPLDYLPR